MTENPICFVIMGFGPKTDYATGRSLDLDKTYQKIIKPAAEKAGFTCVRGDELQESGLIDKSMYALLLRADLVIADISTGNPNAIYELGIRHAARPFSTIIIKEKEGAIPFDLSHIKMFMYEHGGKDIFEEEIQRCVTSLVEQIKGIKDLGKTDSPLYEFVKDLIPLKMSDIEYEDLISDLAAKEKSIFAVVAKAKADMKREAFKDAAVNWGKAAELRQDEPYFIQQQALARYKSEDPSPLTALMDALIIINKLKPDSSNDPETLGITGAIYKNLWFLNEDDPENLNRAIHYYGKGFQLTGDYYTGQNYADCLDLKSDVESNPDEATYFRILARKTRETIITNLTSIEDEEMMRRNDRKVVYGTLSNCYLCLDQKEKAEEFEKKFLESGPASWEIESFNTTKERSLKRIAAA